MLSPLRTLSIVLGTLILVGGLAAPASARPGQVGTPYVTASTPHSLTVNWPPAPGARRYKVTYASSPSKAHRSSAHVKVSKKRRTTVRLTGLRKAKRYCVTVRAVTRHGTGPRSPAHCSFTMRRSLRPQGSTVSVATFNVCAAAPNCRPWRGRERAIVRRILDADADVVAVQESTRRSAELARLLAPYGYARYSDDPGRDDETLYYRTAKLQMSTVPVTRSTCEHDPYVGDDDTSVWEAPRHFDDATGQWYLQRDGAWFTEVDLCRPRTKNVASRGRFGSPTGATAAWASLRVVATGKTYLFVSAHLTHSATPKAVRLRRTETRQLIAKATRVARGRAVVFMGDFNSYRGLNDTPRREMARQGWFDAYDRSATYTRPFLSSLNGWDTRARTLGIWGGHIDRIFIRGTVGSTAWKVVARTKNRRYAGTKASDHNPVRATLHLP
ncbi:endonuclease/exonuclease/phosphatase family protein [Aeromicrobium chenweiae]|uniref:endonuclease/exonuclease/phosphatase family protein n=1 Tax=Aeromicrobium chenweiae TaxID=2079793 RepID=UPI00131EF9C3|nr:endonuclease/exonuclease/phosphatase family protein [Aeromicrobium chenweiae]